MPASPTSSMIPPFPGRPILLALLFVGLAARWGVAPVRAQGNFDTVRTNEIRSRWANYQVDRPPPPTNPTATDTDTAAAAKTEQAGLLAAFGKSFDDLLRNGPLQVRGNLATGWEFSDEENLRQSRPDGTDNSFFIAPTIGLFYNQEQGPLTLSARYSVGYVYYLDQNYLAAGHNGGNLSQTAGLDLGLDGSRLSLTSHSNGSYGNGNDIESGVDRNDLELGETLGATYPLTEFTQLGATGSVGYSRESGGSLATISNLSDSGSAYGDYIITGKTRLRLEFDAGQQLQSSPGSSDTDRYYYQGVVSANYVPAPKISFDAGLGYGFQNDANVIGRGHTGSHPVYRITVQYTPTPKTTASFHFGYEGVDVEPDVQLGAQWEFQVNTSASLSIYQSSSFSDFAIGQNIVTRGVLVSLQQHLFARLDVSLSSGVEQSSGYDQNTGLGARADNRDPYYFGGISLLYEINSYLALQGYYRGYTGQAGEIISEKGLQSRAAVSLRLTF